MKTTHQIGGTFINQKLIDTCVSELASDIVNILPSKNLAIRK